MRSPGKPTVGALNRKAAAEVLTEEGLTVSASDLGGVCGRRIHVHTGTGEVLVYWLGPVVVIGASTGGTEALRSLLEVLPPTLPVL